MAVMPGANYRPMPYENELDPRRGPDTIILHTNGGGSALYGWFSRPGNTICSHFQVFADGRIEQYVDTRFQAYAQWDANPFGISVETEDDGNPATPWTAAQVAAIQKIIRWAGVPALVAPAGGGGVGWHKQYTAWNQSGHDCPGDVRIAQLKNVVIPGVNNAPTPPKEWDEMASEAEFKSAIDDRLDAKKVLTEADLGKIANACADKVIAQFGEQADNTMHNRGPDSGKLNRTTAYFRWLIGGGK